MLGVALLRPPVALGEDAEPTAPFVEVIRGRRAQRPPRARPETGERSGSLARPRPAMPAWQRQVAHGGHRVLAFLSDVAAATRAAATRPRSLALNSGAL